MESAAEIFVGSLGIMAGNTRGKLKEQFEGVHRNFDWIRKHLLISLELIRDHNPKLSEGVKSLAEGIDTMDELAQDIYARL